MWILVLFFQRSNWLKSLQIHNFRNFSSQFVMLLVVLAQVAFDLFEIYSIEICLIDSHLFNNIPKKNLNFKSSFSIQRISKLYSLIIWKLKHIFSTAHQKLKFVFYLSHKYSDYYILSIVQSNIFMKCII